ncbi:MAG TPA: Smr/MutS family protein [Burkholderiaceae bacterium]|nr:Smr/MutS family protein [Burkholderiaceae bacterium]
MRKSDGGLAGLKRLQSLQARTDEVRAPARTLGKKRRRGARPQAETLRASPETVPVGHTTSLSAAPTAPVTEPPPLTVEDAVLFKRAMRSVTPIRTTGRIILPPRPVPPKTLLRQRRLRAAGSEPAPLAAVSDAFAPAATAHDATSFVKAGRGPDLIRDLRRGKWPMQASLDLHGSTLDEARTRLDRFLVSCLSHGIRSVQIVHGKGLGSKDGPVLKQTVRRWLTQIDAVIAYVECADVHGGSGAVQVLLRAPEKPTQLAD